MMETVGQRPSTKTGVFAWALYDWANSAFPTVVITFVFATYFTQGIVKDEVTGTSLWGYAMSVSGLAVALFAPLLGAISDQTGRRKPSLAIFTGIAVLSSAFLWFAEPDPKYIIWALVFAGVGNFAFESGMVFYNAMLPDIARKDSLGRISGWAWGAGYAGGLVCLVIALIGFVQTDTPWFGLEKDAAANIRATTLLVSIWFLVFSIPLFAFTPDRAPTLMPIGKAIYNGLEALLSTLRKVQEYRQIVRYLLARMIYTDGLNTLFAFGGIYAAGSFGFSFTEIIQFGIAINLTAGIGAAAFAWIDDWIGPKKTILIAIVALVFLSSMLLITESKTLFWVFGLGLGIFVGPTQSASRSLMAHMAPESLRTEMFGLYALSGKATAFLGPAAVAFATDMFGNQRAGMSTIIVFFVIGALLMLRVSDPSKTVVN